MTIRSTLCVGGLLALNAVIFWNDQQRAASFVTGVTHDASDAFVSRVRQGCSVASELSWLWRAFSCSLSRNVNGRR